MEKTRDLVPVGYKAFNGHIFTEQDCIRYNRQQETINAFIRDGKPVPEIETNYSHEIFCGCCRIYY